MNKTKRVCACGCGSSINHKHINAKFLNQKHKDKFHNINNPRGYFEHLNPKSSYYNPEMYRHPFDLED